MNFKRLSVIEARELLAKHPQGVQVVDIRDEESFRAGHIGGAYHLHNSNMQDFLAQADPEQPVIVCCYHGHMSQGAAAYLAEQGFAETFSLDGGYEAWSGEDSSS